MSAFGPAADASFPLDRYPSPYIEGAVPVDPTRYGPWSGTILVASEGAGTLESIAADGTVTQYPGFTWAEGVHIVPPNENFFGVDYGDGQLVGAPVSQFMNLGGDVVVGSGICRTRAAGNGVPGRKSRIRAR